MSTRFAERDGGRRVLDKLRPGDVLVVRWLDRLGRDYDDVRDTVQALMRSGVIVRTVINNFTFDGSQTDPIQKSIRDALLAFMSAIGQPKPRPSRSPSGPVSRTRGPPSASISDGSQATGGKGIRAVAREHGVGTGTVQRIKAEMAGDK